VSSQSTPSPRRTLFAWLWSFGPAGYILAAAVLVLVRTVAFAVLVAPNYVSDPDPGKLRLRSPAPGTSVAKVATEEKSAAKTLRFVARDQPDGTTTFSLDPAGQRQLEADARRIIVPKGYFTRLVVTPEMRAAPLTLYVWTAVMILLLLGWAAISRRLPLASGVGALIMAIVGFVVLALINARSAMDLAELYSPVLVFLLFAAGAGTVNRNRPVEMMAFR
jgi:hypothetical protein